MANHFNIPINIEKEIRARDKVCAYCKKKMKGYFNIKGCFKDKATIEHLNYNGPFYWGEKGFRKEDIVICCGSCNSSRGIKKLPSWFKTKYCIDRDINEKTVTWPVKDYIKRHLAVKGFKK